ncbi:hypothetical protein [Chitinophaga sp. 212800010-3]|uniref:hypothetical protein n=1 Tax=unclassified Chitinophaga TaxID=2619133 RepID=UPI002DF36D9A|nr:DUF3575 domain-containing protein [Chitinophaga sp. 212800010-3]
MKKIALMALLLAAGMYYSPSADAQVRVNLNFNLSSQPLWGPVGYDYAEYYYLPDIDVYYCIPEQQFVYFDEDEDDWVSARALPPYYHYDLYRGYKVVINAERPYLNDDYYRRKYRRYKGWYGRQVLIRDGDHDRDHWKEYRHDNGRWHRHGDDQGEDD